MKSALWLLLYFAATLVIGALFAPILFWGAQWSIQHGFFAGLAKFDFESFFHRALLIAAIVLLWPLLRSLNVRSLRDLGLEPHKHRWRDVYAGFVMSAIPLLCCGAILLGLHVFAVRIALTGYGFARIAGATIAVPVVEELFFRGLILGILLRTEKVYLSMFITSAFYSIVHFLKAPERTSTVVSWASGFASIANSFSQFGNPLLLAASFATLFLIGWILADARMRTRSLWLPIGLHAGWIFGSGLFNKLAHHHGLALPWLGQNLLVGIVPIGLACLTWLIVLAWLKYAGSRQT